MNNHDVEEVLRHGAVTIEGRIVASSNNALYGTFELDGVTVAGCIKAEAGERPLWDFPDGLWRREIAAYEFDRYLGQRHVPPTVMRDDFEFGVASVQQWVNDNGEDHFFTLRDSGEHDLWLRSVAIFDGLINNADRKAGHIIFDNDQCWAIDNGLSFHVEDKLRTVIWDWAGDLFDDGARDMCRLAESLPDHVLLDWILPEEMDAVRARATRLLAAGEYPFPDEDGDYPPYPWPLI
jgi:uncharacterized repeat protein (TIGR03843 family)